MDELSTPADRTLASSAPETGVASTGAGDASAHAGTGKPVREEAAIRQLRDRLAQVGGHSADVIDEAVRRAVDRFSEVRVREFVPLLVERLVRDELRLRAAAAGPDGATSAPSQGD